MQCTVPPGVHIQDFEMYLLPIGLVHAEALLGQVVDVYGPDAMTYISSTRKLTESFH